MSIFSSCIATFLSYLNSNVLLLHKAVVNTVLSCHVKEHDTAVLFSVAYCMVVDDRCFVLCVCVFQDEVAHTVTESRVLQNTRHPFLTVRYCVCVYIHRL